MNNQALNAFFTSLSNRCRFHAALTKTARLGHNAAIVKGCNGKPVLAVRYSKQGGFVYRDAKGNIIANNVINNLLRG